MFEIYQKLGLLKAILDEASQYTDIPEGDVDIDRMIASKPAFTSISDSQRYKKKKLVLNIHQYSSNSHLWKLRFIMGIRQLMNDGFEVYQYQFTKNLRLLTNLTVSTLFEGQPDDTNKLEENNI